MTPAAPKVLVVEDDADNRRMLERYLGAKGLTVVATGSPFEVTRLLRREHPDVVILDVMMPALDGEAVAKFIRSEWPTARPAILFYSAMDQVQLDSLSARVLGSTALSKAAGLGALHATLEALIASAQE